MSDLRIQQAKLAERRRQQMAVYRTRGWTLERIAQKYGVSKQRVSQILNGAK